MNFRLFFLAITLLVVACQADNFDEITEVALPYEPIILEEGSQITYRLKQKGTNFNRGYGVVIEDFGIEDYYLSSDTITLCETETTIFPEGGGTSSTNIIASFSNFYITFSIDEPGNVFPGTAYIVEVLGENDILTYYGGFPFVPKCSEDYSTIVNIEEKTDEFIRGTYEAEFFQSVVDSLIAPYPDNCNDWESVGLMQAAFTIPLNTCE